jgi:hypothetical protein
MEGCACCMAMADAVIDLRLDVCDALTVDHGQRLRAGHAAAHTDREGMEDMKH